MNVEVASTIRARLKGLYGRDAFDGVLMLVPCNDIHTFAMRRAIDVAFVAADGAVLEAHRSVLPNRRLRNKRAVATLERFASEAAWFCPGDRILQNLDSNTRYSRTDRSAP
ncbi:MAG: DUF192 domain-containing protein [Eggerthellaceae bacterium]|nr:DUF192 domain-containing protein [Eggerthellaceae bacterium]